jgi:hypothetical protein
VVTETILLLMEVLEEGDHDKVAMVVAVVAVIQVVMEEGLLAEADLIILVPTKTTPLMLMKGMEK